MKIRENVPIKELTTMRMGGEARYVVEVYTEEDVREAYEFAREKGLPVFILGGGANTIGRDEGYEGVIILDKLKGVDFCEYTSSLNFSDYRSIDNSADSRRKSKSEASSQKSGGAEVVAVADGDVSEAGEVLMTVAGGEVSEAGEVLMTVAGGEVWDEVVEQACARGLTGIEALSAIPGTAGAAPVQNIGAYGQEVGAVVERVRAYNSKTGEVVTFRPEEMKFRYRKSIFNTEEAGRYFILEVVLKLRRGEMAGPYYASLQRYIDEHGETDFSPMGIRRIVREIRAGKLPDPEVEASAGSFFKNVYLDDEQAEVARARGVKMWSGDGVNKVNAGWLIEAVGLRGAKMHGMRVSEKAALILINEDAEGYADLAKAREEIRKKVRERFGYELEQEPVEVV